MVHVVTLQVTCWPHTAAISINRRLLSRFSSSTPMSTGLAACPCLTSPPTTLPNGGTVRPPAQTYDYADTLRPQQM